MLSPNTDLLRTVSPYEASGRPRPGHPRTVGPGARWSGTWLTKTIRPLALLLRNVFADLPSGPLRGRTGEQRRKGRTDAKAAIGLPERRDGPGVRLLHRGPAGVADRPRCDAR